MQVIESTGVVVTPYMEYPQLLGMLLQMLSEGSPQARVQVLKVNTPLPIAFLLTSTVVYYDKNIKSCFMASECFS